MPKSEVAQIAIGDTIWYRSTEWEGSQYQKRLVVGETSRSWLVRYDGMWGDPDKLPKSLKNFALGTEHDAKKKLWASANFRDIKQRMEYLYDPDIIIALAHVMNYTVPDEFRQKAGQHEKPSTGTSQS